MKLFKIVVVSCVNERETFFDQKTIELRNCLLSMLDEIKFLVPTTASWYINPRYVLYEVVNQIYVYDIQ